MKKAVIVLLISFMFSITNAKAQANIINAVANQANVLSQESVFVHFNSSLFLAGETLYYKIYCLNDDTKKLSALSTIAYIELVQENQEVIFKHKIKLESGVGYGDFIIPVTANSGNYKLIAYTQWMKNEGVDSFFKSNVSIINPFQGNQDAILVYNDTLTKPSNVKNSLELHSVNNDDENNSLEIKTNKKVFQKRAKATITLKSGATENILGNYSISVRKIDELDRLTNGIPSSNLYVDQRNNLKQKLEKVDHLPELRGELLSGKLLRASDNKPMPNEKVAISIQQNDFILKISSTDQDGIFYFNIDEDYSAEMAILQVLGKDNKDYTIVFNEKQAPLDYNNIDFGTFKISSHYKNTLEQRSIYNQIENGYFELKQNTLKQIDTIQPFFEDYFATFYLDDYTRFAKIQETFVEVVKDAYIKKDDTQKYNFYVTSLDPYEQLEKPAGVIVDGILLQNFDELLNYDSRRIKRISIARTETNFVLGSKAFGGLIVIETIDGKFYDELTKNKLTTTNLFTPQPKKVYYKKEYSSDSTLNRIPDYRNQLLWEPNIYMNDKEMAFDFFTSDNSGEYEISIEGFTINGEPISIRDYIIVN